MAAAGGQRRRQKATRGDRDHKIEILYNHKCWPKLTYYCCAITNCCIAIQSGAAGAPGCTGTLKAVVISSGLSCHMTWTSGIRKKAVRCLFEPKVPQWCVCATQLMLLAVFDVVWQQHFAWLQCVLALVKSSPTKNLSANTTGPGLATKWASSLARMTGRCGGTSCTLQWTRFFVLHVYHVLYVLHLKCIKHVLHVHNSCTIARM